MKEKLYLDSTIPIYYFDQRKSLAVFIEMTRKWWSEMANSYELFISDAVLQELNSGNYPFKIKIIELVSSIPLLPPNQEVEHLVELYINNYLIPRPLIGDAVHLAYASYYDIKYLLTWDYNHLANANKRKHIQTINNRLGLSTPEIVMPIELLILRRFS
ncbi:MAG: type II toxin-antitoxin system VapC family toxin [Candidatus Competibacteraceae bacterium]